MVRNFSSLIASLLPERFQQIEFNTSLCASAIAVFVEGRNGDSNTQRKNGERTMRHKRNLVWKLAILGKISGLVGIRHGRRIFIV